MAKVIVGIHGLANKPDKDTLARWWQTSINEGLKNIGVEDGGLEFRMVYWADLLYKYPVHEDENFHFDKLYNEEPYWAADANSLREYKDGWLDALRAKAGDIGGSLVDIARQKFDLSGVSEWLLGKLLKDLAFYYDEQRVIADHKGNRDTARKVLDATLRDSILAETGNEIMVIAHSMGSIIAYNTLRDIGQINPACKVTDLITIGSPLGLPYVKGKITDEREYDRRVRTPSCVTGRWRNYADRKDPVAIDIHLRDDYSANASSVRVEDDLILNDYHTVSPDGKPDRNAHKSYGYLRAPEVSKHIAAFLGRG